jgi:hypothetical protein
MEAGVNLENLHTNQYKEVIEIVSNFFMNIM